MNKKICNILLVMVAMIALLIAGTGTCLAATANSVVGAIPPILAPGTTLTMASLQIDERAKGNFRNGDVIVLTLPGGSNWNAAYYAAHPAVAASPGNNGGSTTFTATTDPGGVASQVLKLTLNAGAGPTTDASIITIPIVIDVTALGSGDLIVNVAGPGSAVQPGDYVIGSFVTAGATASMLPTLNVSNAVPFYGIIRIIEREAHSLAVGKTIILELPEGFEWSGVITAVPATGGLKLGSNSAPQPLTEGTLAFDNNRASITDKRTAIFTIGAESSSPAIINIKVNMVMSPGNDPAKLLVAVKGSAITTDNVIVGSNASYGVAVTAGAAPTITAGKTNQKMADITITEEAAGSLIGGRTLTLTLPGNVIFQAPPALNLIAGDDILDGITSDWGSQDDQSRISFTLGNSSLKPATILIHNIQATTAPNVTGAINLLIGGTAGASGSATIARAITPSHSANGNARSGRVATALFTLGTNQCIFDGMEKSMDVAPYIQDDRVYLPLRFLSNSLGIDDNYIVWNESSQTVALLRDNKIVQLKIGNKNITVNGVLNKIDVAPEIVNGRTMMPASWVVQAFGASVSWDPQNQVVSIYNQVLS